MVRYLFLVWMLLAWASTGFAGEKPRTKALSLPPASASVEASLPSASGHIRQFAFDGNEDTYFASESKASKSDQFTLTFDTPAKVHALRVTTGRPAGGDALKAGVLEISEDGVTFVELGRFNEGTAAGKPKSKVKSVRVRPTEDLQGPLVIREITVDANVPVPVFHYPIEIVIDVREAPEMKAWAEKVARVCERQYPMICSELMSEGFKPLSSIQMTLKSDYNGVAFASGSRITGSVKYFKANPNDVGAMVHETAHCVQLYRSRKNPGWLVEGVADYVRFFKYEETKPKPLPPNRAKYDASYRVSAAFLAYLTEKYDAQIVRKLNAIMRAGTYHDGVWQELTGKSADELGKEWQTSLMKK